jgi:hypothetical protein
MWMKSLIAAAASVAIVATAVASSLDIDLGDLTISNPIAYEARAGSRTKLRMGLSNDGATAVHIVGLTTPVARAARFRLRAGPSFDTALEAISVPAEDVLELGASSLWVEHVGLSRALRPGQVFR